MLPLQAPPAEGEGEGEGCDVVCVDAATLQFCDDGLAVTLSCADVDDGAVCAESPDLGFDCQLPAGTACDPDYAFGASRCVPGLACINGVCAPGTAPGTQPLQPTPGTSKTTVTTTTPLSCIGCSSTSALSWPLIWLPALLMRWRRRG